jgi:chromosome segregation ATPase
MKTITQNSAINRLHEWLQNNIASFDADYAEFGGDKATIENDRKMAKHLRQHATLEDMTGGVVAKYRAELARHAAIRNERDETQAHRFRNQRDKALSDLAEARKKLEWCNNRIATLANNRTELRYELKESREQNAELQAECNRLDQTAKENDTVATYRADAIKRLSTALELTRARLSAAEAYIRELLREYAE